MFHSGISDEAGTDLATQIKAHKELGWSHIELRNVDGESFAEVDDATFDRIKGALDEAGLQVSCFASPIANWATKITDPLDRDMAILKTSIPRMQAMGTQFIRVMSWNNDGLSESEWEAAAVSEILTTHGVGACGDLTL